MKYKEDTYYSVTLNELIEIFENDTEPNYWQYLNLEPFKELGYEAIILEFENDEPVNIQIFTTDMIYLVSQRFESYATLDEIRRDPPREYEVL